MKELPNVGIIGQGFVGTAVMTELSKTFPVFAYDKDSNKSVITSKEYVSSTPTNLINVATVVENCEVIFVCVPTPMFEDGECDLRIVESVIKDIAKEAEFQDKNVITIIKSTVPPGTTETLNGLSNRVGVTFSPEFLTEANAIKDFENQTRVVLGIDYMEYIDPVKEIFQKGLPNAEIIIINSKEAEMTKYATNLFLATKVSFFNDIYSLCEKLDIKYDDVIEATMYDPRIGKSHYNVPGPDGDRGFGGHCFPGTYEVLTTNGSITLEEAYNKFTSGELLEVISSNHNILLEESKIVKDVTKNNYSGHLIKFTLEDGNILECTPSHIFPILRDGHLVLLQAKDIISTDDFIPRSAIDNKKTLTYNANKIL